MINNHKVHGDLRIQLSMQIKLISSLDTNEFGIMHAISDNIEILTRIKTDDIINELFKSILKKYQEGLEKKWG